MRSAWPCETPKNPDGPKLTFTRGDWAVFITKIKDGRSADIPTQASSNYNISRPQSTSAQRHLDVQRHPTTKAHPPHHAGLC